MKKICFLFAFLISTISCFSQGVSINTSGATSDGSAILDVSSDSLGVLIPRMTYEQRNNIANPAGGLLIFCSDCGSEGSLSMFSNGTWKSFTPCSSSAPTSDVNIIAPGQIIWKWHSVTGAVGYRWNSTDDYTSAEDLGTVCEKTETGILCDSIYTRYAWSYNSCSTSPYTILKDTVPPAPAAPTAGTHDPGTILIFWQWNSVTGADGYKWNTTNDYLSATDMGTDTSFWEQDLIPDSLYARYVWAYNTCGPSSPTILTCQTLENYYIGQGFMGGIIFYIDATGNHGYIAAPSDEYPEEWGCYGFSTMICNDDGELNTYLIADYCGYSAAWVCYYLELNGYDDWFLPSITTLNLLYQQKDIVGGFSNEPYWTSCEYDGDYARCQSFTDGSQYSEFKLAFLSFRPVRSY